MNVCTIDHNWLAHIVGSRTGKWRSKAQAPDQTYTQGPTITEGNVLPLL